MQWIVASCQLLHCCCVVEFLSSHISAKLCCSVPSDLPEAFRINLADPHFLQVNSALLVAIGNEICDKCATLGQVSWLYAKLDT